MLCLKASCLAAPSFALSPPAVFVFTLSKVSMADYFERLGKLILFVEGEVSDVHMMEKETPGLSYVCNDQFVLIEDLNHPLPIPFSSKGLHHPQAWSSSICIDYNAPVLCFYEIRQSEMKLQRSLVVEGIRKVHLTDEELIALREKEGNSVVLEVYDWTTTVSTLELRQEIAIPVVQSDSRTCDLAVNVSGQMVLVVVNAFLYVYIKSHGQFEYVGLSSFTQPILSIGFDLVGRIVAVTPDGIWSSPYTVRLKKPLRDGKKWITHCSLVRLQALMDTSVLELSSSASISLILLRAIDHLEALFKMAWKGVNPIRLRLKQNWRWCEEEEKVKEVVEIRKFLDAECRDPISEAELIQFDKAFQYVQIAEWDEEETERIRTILRILLWRKKAIQTMDLDENALQYLLTLQLVANKLLPVDSIPSSALLFASFSNSKDTLVNEALTILAKARLGVPTTPLASPSLSVSSPSTSSPLTPKSPRSPASSAVSQALNCNPSDGLTACSDRYRSLFTFTSNRTHFTFVPEAPTVTIREDEDMMQHITWEDIRGSGLVLWCRSQSMYTKFALKIAVVCSILRFISHRINIKPPRILTRLHCFMSL